MALIGGLNRDTTDELLVRVRLASLAMLLLGGLCGGVLMRFWPELTGSVTLEQRFLLGAAVAAPLVFALVVYLYLSLGVIRALRGRFDSLKRAAQSTGL